MYTSICHLFLILNADDLKKGICMSENVSYDVKNNVVEFKINPAIYPLGVIFQTADVFIDRAYVYLDGDTEKEISVVLKPKEKEEDLEKCAGDFQNELVSYAAYFVRAQVNKDIREAMLKRAFLSVSPINERMDEKEHKEFESKKLEKVKIDIGTKVPIMDNIEKTDASLDDIAKPWDEQKGKIDKK